MTETKKTIKKEKKHDSRRHYMTIDIACKLLKIIIDRKAERWNRILQARSEEEETITIELTVTACN